MLANGESRARWQISLARQPAEAGDEALVAEEPVQAHRVLGQQRARGWRRRPCRRRGRGRASGSCSSGSPSTHPHAGLALGAGLGEQQRPAVGEPPAGLAEPRLGRLLLVGLEAAALHEVDDEGELAEVEQQVLAPAPHRRARGRRPPRARGIAVLSTVKASGVNRSQRGAGEVGVEPLGVGLDLGELRHGPLANTSSIADQRAGSLDHGPQVAAEPQPALHEGRLGRQLAAVDGLGGGPILGEGDVGVVGPPALDARPAVGGDHA